MNKFRLTFNVLAIATAMFAFASVAQAQTRTWVSGVGDDVNPCSRTAPCKTFAGAIIKTGKDGEINTLDPGGFGAVTITKSITIDGTTTGAGGLNDSGSTGVVVNISDAADVRKLVTLRALNINGTGSGIRGIRILAAAGVLVENCYIAGQNGNPGAGIEDTRSAGGFLHVNNTTVINSNGNGISVNPNIGNTQINVHITNSRLIRNTGSGLFVGSNVHAVVFNSEITQNIVAGVFAQQTAGGITDVHVDQSKVSTNVTAFQANTNNSVIRVSNTTAVYNVNLAVTAGGGQVSSYGNNHTAGLAFPSPGTAPSE